MTFRDYLPWPKINFSTPFPETPDQTFRHCYSVRGKRLKTDNEKKYLAKYEKLNIKTFVILKTRPWIFPVVLQILAKLATRTTTSFFILKNMIFGGDGYNNFFQVNNNTYKYCRFAVRKISHGTDNDRL